MDPNLIVCTNLQKNYGAFAALRQVNLIVGRGRIIGLLGPNGSGKTTLIKLLCGLLQPSSGELRIDGVLPGPYTKSIISYLPDKMYFADWMKTKDIMDLFEDFYEDFNRKKAEAMCQALGIRFDTRIKTMSKGTKEKLQLILVMSRNAQLYLLDEPIAGVDPAARDYILNTILSNYNENGTVIISTHLISDVEKVLDEVIFLRNGEIVRYDSVDHIREEEGKSVDEVFREVFRTVPYDPYGTGMQNTFPAPPSGFPNPGHGFPKPVNEFPKSANDLPNSEWKVAEPEAKLPEGGEEQCSEN